jgi:hypothetical protein
MGGPASIAEYIQPAREGRGRLPFFDPNYFKYHFLIEHYLKLFGPSSVLVLPFELFVSEPSVFLHQIIRFSGADENLKVEQLPLSKKERSSLSAWSTLFKRRMNFLFAYDRLNPGALFPNRKLDRKLFRFLSTVQRYVPESYSKRCEDRLRSMIQEFTRGKYADSNSMIAGIFHLDLEAFGYSVGSKNFRRV